MKQHSGSSRKLSFFYALAWLLGAVLALSGLSSNAQQLTGTISGTAYDQSGAVVPKAKVVLKNEASGDVRTTVTGDDGHFVITAVQPATYSIEVSAAGFLELAGKRHRDEHRRQPRRSEHQVECRRELHPGQRGRRGRRHRADRYRRDQHLDQHRDDQRLPAPGPRRRRAASRSCRAWR